MEEPARNALREVNRMSDQTIRHMLNILVFILIMKENIEKSVVGSVGQIDQRLFKVGK